ncbi:ATP-binding protein [Nocardioides antri]|uniref:LuxR family transcriptional regulator n=1 Tax=Nocardioides antri TaxID=2607659 RepID=A0A5B1MAB2_9ACTN|nr:LuxR C-terminal-related transcriptional regulator [Nocardioides antri]KAA1428660.1 LuxR family transcriptional regulator [Nocardioides antri]
MGALASETLARRKDNLPVEVTSFVGRRRELTELRQLLTTARLVTVTGPGGVGKTRLALRLAADLRRVFPDGVWMVGLDALTASGMVSHAVAASLDVQELGSADPVASLAAQLEDRRLLLVLDNCEHVLDESSALATHLLRTCPEVRVLATSRQALGVAGEFIFNLAPFSVPKAEDLDQPELDVPGRDAVSLFTERARAVVPGFELTRDNRGEVAALCARLDGIPLAIELASARLRALSLAQIVERLDDRFRLLTGSRSAEPRQQTLRSVVDWSFDLCTPEERRLWQRASVFAGGFDLAAAEAICSGDELPREAVLDVVASLVDKSILNREDHGASARYLMLDTLREYGGTRHAASGEERSTRERHRRYFASIADDPVFGPSAREVLDRLRLEQGNLRAALEFCATDPEQVVPGLDLASSLWKFWTAIGAFAEGRTWLGRLLDGAPQEAGPSHARALCTAGWLASLQNDLSTAAELLQRSATEAADLGDRSLDGYLALFSGGIATSEGRNAEARASYEQALEAFRATGEPTGIVMTLRRLAMAESMEGRHDRAAAYYEECLQVCNDHGEVWEKAYTLWGRGLEAWRQADHGQARKLLRECISINSSFGDDRGVALGIEGLAWVAADEQEAELAAGLLGAADAIWRTFDAPMSGYLHLAHAHAQCEDVVRHTLGKQAYAAAFERGAQLTPERATEYALDPDRFSARSGRRPRPVDASTPLTRREQEIAGLVAKGLTNREIASQLVISDRTAEGHVEHILTKLGFRSRTQIAAWVMEQGLHHDHDDRTRD